MKGKIVVITASDQANGFKLVEELAIFAPKVIIIGCLNTPSNKKLIKQLKLDIENTKIKFIELNQSDLVSVQEFVL